MVSCDGLVTSVLAAGPMFSSFKNRMTALALSCVSPPNPAISCESVSQMEGCAEQNCRISDMAVIAAVRPSEMTASGVDRIRNERKG